jgi:hypothetical protein
MRDITQEYSSLTEYAVRILDIVIIFALAHSAALLRLSVPLNTLSNSHLIVTYLPARFSVMRLWSAVGFIPPERLMASVKVIGKSLIA